MNSRNRAPFTLLLAASFLSMSACGSNPDSAAEQAGSDGGTYNPGSGGTGGTGGAMGGGSTGDWTGFVYPEVTFTDEAQALAGSTVFATCVPNAVQMMKDQCLLIAQELYTDNKDPRVPFSTLNLFLRDDPIGPANKWSNNNSPTDVSIALSAQYIESFYHSNGTDCDVVLKEVKGLLEHMGTYGYQWTPNNCGTYDDASSTFWGLVEGEADGVRAELANWTPTPYALKGGNWNDGYTTGGLFLSWCKHNKKPTFLIELNHAAHDLAKFTWDAAFQQILGQSVQSVWNEYQATLP